MKIKYNINKPFFFSLHCLLYLFFNVVWMRWASLDHSVHTDSAGRCFIVSHTLFHSLPSLPSSHSFALEPNDWPYDCVFVVSHNARILHRNCAYSNTSTLSFGRWANLFKWPTNFPNPKYSGEIWEINHIACWKLVICEHTHTHQMLWPVCVLNKVLWIDVPRKKGRLAVRKKNCCEKKNWGKKMFKWHAHSALTHSFTKC